LDISSQWAIKNKLEFNVLKSYNIGTECLNLRLGHQILPTSQEEKYLGAPLTKNGIHWEKLFGQQLTKARAILGFLELKGKSWNEISRYRIFQTFCLSQLNYCIGPFYEKMERTGQLRKLEKDLQEFDLRVLKFIFGTTVPRPEAVLRSMLPYPPTISRLEYLHSSTVLHIRSCHPDNPIHILKDAYPLPIYSDNQLLPRMFLSTTLLRTLESQKKDLPQLTLKDLWKETFLGKLPSDQKMHLYISSESRKRKHGPDRALMILNDEIRKNAIEWRRNLLFHNKQCPVCNMPFHRTHFDRCLLSTMPHELRPPENLFDEYISEKQDLPIHCSSDYSLIDSALNNCLYNWFGLTIDWIKSKLL
jgi:hypothetical protein